MRLGILTNILTPYRVHFFDKISAELEKRKGALRVWVMARTEPGRTWDYFVLRRPYTELLPGIHPVVARASFHVNPGALLAIRRFRPDLLVQAGGWAIPTTLIVLSSRRLFAHMPLLFWTESHARQQSPLRGPIAVAWARARRQVYSRFDGFVVPGKLAGEFADAVGGIERPRIMLPNVVDEQHYTRAYHNRSVLAAQGRRKLGLPEGVRVYLIVARLAPEKGILHFLRQAGPWLAKHRVSLIVAGDGPERSPLERWHQQNPEVELRLLGNVGMEDMLQLYAVSDYFLLPSLSDPNPLAVVEALWTGLPLLLSDRVGNWPEAVMPGRNGFIFDPMDPSSVSKALEASLSASEAWVRDARRLSFELAQRYFDSAAAARRFIEDLEQLKPSLTPCRR